MKTIISAERIRIGDLVKTPMAGIHSPAEVVSIEIGKHTITITQVNPKTNVRFIEILTPGVPVLIYSKKSDKIKSERLFFNKTSLKN